MKKDAFLSGMAICCLSMAARFPFGALYACSDVLCFFLRVVVRYRRKVIRKNLRLSFPEKDGKELRAIEKEYYCHLCDCIVEAVKLLHVGDEEMKRRVEVRNYALIEEMAGDGRSIILFLGHYGNWEWVQEICKYYKNPRLSAEIYRPAKSVVFNEILKRIRSRFDTVLIPQKKAVRQLLGYHKEGKQFMVGFISDQRPNHVNLNHWTTFLNQDTPYAAGGEDIGMHINAHFVYLDIQKTGRGRYVLTFKRIEPCGDNEPYPYTRAFLGMLEKTIQAAPQYWLWSHNRWKYKRKR